MIISMVLIGVVTVIGVVIIAAVETKRMEKGKPSLLSRKPKEQRTKEQTCMNRKGFTLIELLVVIAIIALLMSISLPITSHVKKQAKAVVCRMHLKQWGGFFSMYADDYDGKFMRGWWAGGAVKNNDVWMGALRPYHMNEHEIRCCPMAAKPGTAIGGHMFGGGGGVARRATFYAWGVFDGSWDPPATPGDYGSYGGNGYIYSPPRDVVDNGGIPTKWNWRRADVSGAANIPLFLDAQWWDGWPLEDDPAPKYEGEPWGGHVDMMERFCISRHDGFVNCIFLDCNVRPVGLKELWKLKWHRNYDVHADAVDFPDWLLKLPD